MSAFNGDLRKRGRILAVLSCVVALCASLVTHNPAKADSGVAVSGLSLVKSDANGNPSTTLPVREDHIVKLTFNWDGKNTILKSGDSFTVALPSIFDNLEYPQTRELKIDYGGSQAIVGRCELTQKKITCSFDDKVEELRGQGFTNFAGTATTLLRVVETTTSDQAAITVNGTATDVDIPGGSIQEAEKSLYKPMVFNKETGNLTATSKSILRESKFGSDYVRRVLETVTTSSSNIITTAANADSQNSGRFSVAKKIITDNNADFINSTYDVDYFCSNGILGTLSVPGDGKVVDGPLLPNGTTCDISESYTSARKQGYSVATLVDNSHITIVKDKTVPVIITNHYWKLNTNFVISKTVAGDAASIAPKTYEFDYVCKDEWGQIAKTGNATVEAGKSTVVADVPSGECTVTERDANVKGARWEVASEAIEPDAAVPSGTHSASPITLVSAVRTNSENVLSSVRKEGKKSVTFSLLDNDSIPVNFKNTYTKLYGSFSVAKKVESPRGLDLSKQSFAFDYVCTSEVEGEIKGQLKVPGDGSAVAAGVKVPLYATCKVSENSASAAVEGYDVKLPAEQTFTIDSEGEVKALQFTNVYTNQTGDFSVAKKVSGVTGHEDKEFAFAYECSDGTKGNLAAKSDGKAVASGKTLPAGTTCTITEDASKAKIDGHAVKTPEPQKVTILAGKVVETTFVNEYEATPSPSPSATPEPSGPPSPSPSATPSLTPTSGASVVPPAATGSSSKSKVPSPGKGTASSPKGTALPRTGASVLALGLVALGALTVGTAFVLRRRRN